MGEGLFNGGGMQCRIVCSAFLAAFLVVFSPLAVRAQLDADFRIGGGILVGPSTTTCDGTKTGGLRWSSANSTFEMCDGVSWQKISASTCDSAPAFFIFTDQSMLATSTLVTSNIVSITGMDAGCSASVGVSGTGGSPEYRICSTSNCSSVDIDWTAGNNTLAMQGKYMQLRATTSASAGTTFTITANIGTTDSDWDIMTQHADCSANPIGSVCGDGTVYAGLSPDGSVPMFVTRCDAGQSWTGSCTGTRTGMSWNDGNSSWVDTALVNCSALGACSPSGESNTVILINTDSNSNTSGLQNHVAAKYCADLSSNGYTDWYLPSIEELNVLYGNRTAIGGFTTVWYRSSQEANSSMAGIQSFSNGDVELLSSGYNKASAPIYVRCVRRNADVTPTSLSFTDQTNQAAAALILSNIVQITGIDTATSVAIINKSADGTGTPEYRICSDSSCAGVVTGWNSAINAISNNQYVQARMYANGTPGAVNSAAIIVGDLSDQWSLTTSAADPCAGSPSPGAVCADGTVYAGLSPDGNVAMYTTRCVAGQTWSAGSCTGAQVTKSWADGATNYTNTTLIDCGSPGACGNSGELDTLVIINNDSNGVTAGTQAHEAAQYCADLSIHGQTDWYLPAVAEAEILAVNQTQIGNFSTNRIWTSSETSTANAWGVRFSDNSALTSAKSTSTAHYVRCVRRDVDITPAALSFTDLTNQTAAALVTSNIFQVTGLGAATSVAVTSKSADGSGNPEYRICSDSSCTGVVTGWNSSVNALSNNQYVQLRMYANGAASAVNSALVIVGDTTDQWDVTTSSSDPCAGSPSPGAVCTDGSVYAGLSPDGNVAMYVPRCDAGQTWGASGCVNARTPHSWNAGNGGGQVNTTLADCGSAPAGCAASGETNTNTLITEDADSITGGTQPHAAAQYCADLNIHGQTDWYLPSAQELNVIYGNRLAIGSFDTSGSIAGWYWSSSESNITYAWPQRFSDGLLNNNPTGSKTGSYQVRCARR